MTILIGHGYVGAAIAEALTTRGVAFDWMHHDENWEHIPYGVNDFVINAAGYVGQSNVDACEVQRTECIEGNIFWPLECDARARSRPVIHIGSGCLYEGGPWSEENGQNFFGSLYSVCKGIAERRINKNNYVLRVRMPFSRQLKPHNLLAKLASYSMLVDSENSLTCLEDAADAIAWLCELPVVRRPEPGIYNFTNPGAVTTKEIVSLLGIEKLWFENQEAFLKTVVAERSFCTLNTDKAKRAGFHLRPVRHALQDCVDCIKGTSNDSKSKTGTAEHRAEEAGRPAAA